MDPGPRTRTLRGPIIRFEPAATEPKLRLICWPHAGGSGYIYRSWARTLAERAAIEVCAVELPGRGSRMAEPCKLDWEALLDDVMPSLVETVRGAPFAFFGHSMGGTLAFEAARRLRHEGRPLPRHLFIAASSVPHLGSRHARSPLHRLPDAELLEAIAGMSGTPRELLDDPELMALVLPILRADLGVVERYVYQEGEALAVPLSLLLGERDGRVDNEDARHGWRTYTSCAYEVRVFDGDHFFPATARDAVLATLEEALRGEG